MSNYKCTGNGYCIQQCVCIFCFDSKEATICICGHRNHPKLIGGETDCDIYCKQDCEYNCQLLQCHNFKVCNQKRPQWLLSAHNGMCINCAVHYGKMKFLERQEECPICMEHKDMVEISCERHNVCFDCWKHLSESGIDIPMKCPFCRESIWKRKK
jgi:hypothetical protein